MLPTQSRFLWTCSPARPSPAPSLRPTPSPARLVTPPSAAPATLPSLQCTVAPPVPGAASLCLPSCRCCSVVLCCVILCWVHHPIPAHSLSSWSLRRQHHGHGTKGSCLDRCRVRHRLVPHQRHRHQPGQVQPHPRHPAAGRRELLRQARLPATGRHREPGGQPVSSAQPARIVL